MINSFLQKMSTWVTAKSNISTRIDFLLLTNVTFLRAITMCSSFTLDCGYDDSTIILIWDVYCPNTKCLGKVCLHKMTFQSLGRSDYQCPQCASACQVRIFPFEDQTNSFFLSLGRGVYIFIENPKSIQGLITGDVYCPGDFCLSREICKSIGGYVTTPRSIYGCDNCGAWLFAHKLPFTFQEHVKTTKTDKTRFFLAKKRWTCYTTNTCSIKSHFSQPNIERRNCVWTTSGLLGMCIVANVETKIVLTFQPLKRLVSTILKSAKPAVTFWKFLWRTKNKPTIMLFGGVGTHCFARKSSPDYKKPSPFLMNFLRESQSPASKKVEMSPNME